ncbi:MAG TPA: response regulator transcription factor [Acidimicrobiales bacterium]|nr:response regulator transcription factor [Acidimicrobiales bacterium]
MRVVLADDALLVREGLSRVLAHAGVDVVASVGDLEELLAAVEAEQPDIAIVDIRMPPGYRDEGIQAAARLAQSHPDLGVLVLSQYVEPNYAAELIAASPGRRGYLLKERILHQDQLLQAMERIDAGETVVDPSVVDAAIATSRPSGRLGVLTDRELEVLHLIAQGLTDRGICDRLVLSPKTVATHTQHIFNKLGLPASSHDNRRVHAVLTYMEPH